MLTVSHIPEAIKDQGSRLGMLIWPLFLIPPTWRGVANLTSTLFPKALPRCCFFQRTAANFNCFSYQHHHHHLHPSSTSHIHHLHHLHHLHYHHHFHHHLHPSSTSSTWLTSSRSFTWSIYSTGFYTSPMWSIHSCIDMSVINSYELLEP